PFTLSTTKKAIRTLSVSALAGLILSYSFVPVASARVQNRQNQNTNISGNNHSRLEARRAKAAERKMSLEIADNVDDHKKPGSYDPWVRVIVQTHQPTGWRERAAMLNSGANIKREFRGVNGAVMDLPLSKIELLAQHPSVKWVSPDRQLEQMDTISSHIEITTGLTA